MRYIYYTDPGHGWLQVRTVELIELGIVNDITPYSYLSNDGLYAYLEEDLDMSTFVNALGIGWDNLEYTYQHTTVRNNPGYDPQWVMDNRDVLLALAGRREIPK